MWQRKTQWDSFSKWDSRSWKTQAIILLCHTAYMCNVVKPDLYFVVVGLRASGEEMHEGPALFFLVQLVTTATTQEGAGRSLEGLIL